MVMIAFHVLVLTCFALLQRVVPDDHHGVHHRRDPQGGDNTGTSNGRHGWNGLLRHHTHGEYTSDQHGLGFFLFSGASSSLVYFGC
jgi:hypothetical protein